MFRIFIFTFMAVFIGCQATWSSLGNIQDPQGFFVKAVQEMIYEVEKRGWSQLKMTDYVIPINQKLYNWLVVGNTTYSNGFLISIQKIDVSDISPRVGTTLENNQTIEFASVQGNLNLRDVKVGLNVEADLGEEGVHKVTGSFTHTLVQLRLIIQKNLVSEEIITSSTVQNLSAGSGVRMIYMPSSNITEALSRAYVPSRNWDSAGNWGREIFAPTLYQVVKEKVPFPHVCFKQC